MPCEIGFKPELAITHIISTGINLIDILPKDIIIYITIGPTAIRVKIINLFLEHCIILIDPAP